MSRGEGGRARFEMSSCLQLGGAAVGVGVGALQMPVRSTLYALCPMLYAPAQAAPHT
jgi:hypothetical protein